MIQILKNLIGEKKYLKLKEAYFAYRYTHDLNKLATVFGTDKWGSHFYTKHYQRFLQHLKDKKFTMLEIGVGGYENPNWGGGSLKMWRAFFRKAQIVSFDIYDKTHLSGNRLTVEQGSQNDEEFLKTLEKKHGPFEVVLDDGSHINSHVIKTFNVLFPLLKEGGYYIIEDTQTSYFPEYGGDSQDLNNPKTMMGFFKQVPDYVNHQEILENKHTYLPFYQDIYSISFFHNLIFIHKKKNDEASNMVKDGKLIGGNRILE
jgi:cephalosporin hydroxylase